MSPKWRVRWIEILLLGGILLIIASFVLRIVYGQQMREAEERFVTSFGINDGIYFAIKIILAVFAIFYFAKRYRKSKKDS
jgi:heme/copper-type cytochrome/quinol oxidase subunit 2